MTMPAPQSIPSLLEQAMGCAASFAAAKGQKSPWPPNPFPTGPKAGCTTERVLALLQAEHPKHLEHGQLRMMLGATRGMITWSLRYLESMNLVARVSDPRNPQYRRYRAVRSD